MRVTCRCGATWIGWRVEHCTVCHQTFSGVTAGDAHRTGRYDTTEGPDRRRCLTPDEMRATGMRLNERGHWITHPGTPPWTKNDQEDE